MVEVGDWILAAGNPFGLGSSVSAGIVSARGRDIGAGPFDDFLQIDAPINPGNSGGPTFNLDGQVIAVNTAIVSPTGGSVGIGFAIPSEIARPHRAGAAGARGTSTAVGWGSRCRTFRLTPGVARNRSTGVAIANVDRAGPAARSGLQGGDVVTAVNGAAGGQRARVDQGGQRDGAGHRRPAHGQAARPGAGAAGDRRPPAERGQRLMRILVVEDDKRCRGRIIVKGLREAGHLPEHADNGRDGLFMAASESFDAIILDRMLPGGIDGLRLLETLRAQDNATPVLFLSALGQVDERVRGLKAGGDDYLTKPFAFAELLARVEALARRGRGDAPTDQARGGRP